MTKSAQLNVTQNYNTNAVNIVNASGATGTANAAAVPPSNVQTLFTAGANDSVIDSIIAATDDTTARTLAFWLYNGSTYFFLGAVTVAITAGSTGAIATVDCLGALFPGLPLNPTQKSVIELKTGWSLVVGSQVAVTASKTLSVTAQGQDY